MIKDIVIEGECNTQLERLARPTTEDWCACLCLRPELHTGREVDSIGTGEGRRQKPPGSDKRYLSPEDVSRLPESAGIAVEDR